MPLAARLVASKIRRMATAQVLLGSTLQSLRRNRPTEIDYLNGEVVRVGRQVGVATSLNAALVEMVHHIERTGDFWSVDAVGAAITARAGRGC